MRVAALYDVHGNLPALEQLRGRDKGDPGAWWEAGLRENLDDEPED